MSAATARHRRAAVPPLMRRGGEAAVFAVATTIALVHALDDAFVHRGPGLALSQHALAGTIALVAAVAAIAVFPSLRPGLRAALAGWLGVLAVVNGALHVNHVSVDGASAADVTGVLALAAGVVLVGLAAWIPWRHRGAGPAGPWHRRANRVLAVAGALVAIVFVVGPMAMGLIEAHKWREPIGPPPGPEYASVAFRASDGLRLAGWYRASRNGAAVIVVHGGGGDRTGAMAHARLLARHGYGVLVYDARGRGESEGSPNGYGWDWGKDVAGALGFLRSRPDVDPRRIGALGLSTGADVLVEVAAQRRDLAAIVADGTAAGSFEDWRRLRGTELGLPPGWVMFTTIRVLAGDAPGPPLQDLLARMRTPTLLVSAGTDVERDFNVLYARGASGAVAHWNLPDAHHTAALREHPRAYERRVVGFLDRALRPGDPIERTP